MVMLFVVEKFVSSLKLLFVSMIVWYVVVVFDMIGVM